MPKGYIIAKVRVHDMEQYKKYMAKSPGALADAGGRFIVRGGRSEMLEGEGDDRRTVVVEYESYEAAKASYLSEAYQSIIPLRADAAEAEFMVIEGFDG